MGHAGSKRTLLSYLGFAREIPLLFEAHLFSPTIKNQLLYPRKIYGMDQGLKTDDEYEDVRIGKERIAARPFWLWALEAPGSSKGSWD